ncbi:EAL domain-containing protein [Robbsia andropogonis]|nr:EAL domain-containing protein [Robbsia andropogonis]MCP1119902.1 EAL domain-containing protein [Robbsia andropogonis]MCP1129772.1 EAL domain-containing protein [Robbsia andropogonis]
MPRPLLLRTPAMIGSILIVVFCTLAGAAIGTGIGQTTAVAQQRTEAGVLAQLWLRRVKEIGAEADRALAAINQYPAPLCSDADIAHLRAIVLESRFLKSAARERDGKIICTSTDGRADDPITVPTVDFVNSKGQQILLNPNVDGVSGAQAIVIRQGHAAIAIHYPAYDVIVDPRVDYMGVSIQGTQRFLLTSSEVSALPSGIVLHDKTPVRLANHRFEVRCTQGGDECILARMRDASSASGLGLSPELLGFLTLGMMAGFGIGMGLCSAMRRANSMARRMRRDLKHGKLTLEYQPVVRLADGQWVGAEALLRWTETNGRHINPDLFIQLAEDEGFIQEVSRYVVTRVLDELGDTLRARPDFKVAINISATDVLTASFPAWVALRLAAANVAPSSIAFEITERTTAEHSVLARGIKRLRDNGHAVYIDDFGTQYSSLSYLSSLPVTAVKLDKSFCRGLPEDEKLGVVASRIAAMVAALKLDLIVEGIEHAPQAVWFQHLYPPPLGQGWLFARAMPAAHIAAHCHCQPPKNEPTTASIHASLA